MSGIPSQPTLVDRRDARHIKQLARDLCVSVETIEAKGGPVDTLPAALLVQFFEALGPQSLEGLWVCVDGQTLRQMRQPAGLRSIDDELRAVRSLEQRTAPASIPTPTPTPALPTTKTRQGVRNMTVTPAQIRDLLNRRAWTPMRLAAELVDAGVPTVSTAKVEGWLAGRNAINHLAANTLLRLIDDLDAEQQVAVPPPMEPPSPAETAPPALEAGGAMEAEEVRDAMQYLGLSHQALADAIEVTESAVRNWTSGRYRVSAVNALKIRALIAAGKSG